MRFGRLAIPPAIVRLAQVAMAIGLLAYIWHVADGPQALRILMEAEIVWFVAAFAALTLQTVMSALRWRLTAAQLGIRLDRLWAVREYYMAQIVNQSLPGGMIGDAGRAVRARGQAGLLASGQAVVFERLAGQAAMFSVMAPAFLITLVIPGGFDWPRWLVLPVGFLIGAGCLLPVLVLILARLPGPVGRKTARFCQTMVLALGHRHVLPRQVIFSIGTTVCNLSAFTFCAVAVGADLSFLAVIVLVPLILFTMLIPISTSGWGLREGAAAALFPLAGATQSEGLAASVAFGVIFLVSVLPGAVPMLLAPSAKAAKNLGTTKG